MTKNIHSLSIFSKGKSLGELIELRSLPEHDTDLGINLPPSLTLNVLLPDALDGRIAVLRQDLRELESEGDALPHALNLHAAVLLEDQLRQEETLVQSRTATHAVDVGFVELLSRGGHQHSNN